jgi:hypothetical protein
MASQYGQGGFKYIIEQDGAEFSILRLGSLCSLLFLGWNWKNRAGCVAFQHW